jgi:NADP-dependent 3-hydroxy acid dehydrogenase YdfG
MLIDQRIVVIGGGSSRIGLAVAKAAEDAGADVLIASSSETKLDQALKQLSGKAKGVIVNVANKESVQSLFNAIGEIDHIALTVGTEYKPVPVTESEFSESHKPFTRNAMRPID